MKSMEITPCLPSAGCQSSNLAIAKVSHGTLLCHWLMLTNAEHAFPLFCPQSLVEYRSMDIPDLMAFLNSRNRLKPEEIEIEEGDRSKRLDQEVLERYWTQNSQGRQMKIPFWANADGVVQQIIHQDACRNPSTSPSPPPLRTPSLLYNEPRNGSPSQEHVTTTATTSTSTELDSGSQILRGPETPLSEFSQSAPADSHKDERKPRSLSGNLSRTPLKAKARLAGPRPGRDSRVTKRSWKPAMGLRSCQVTKFYELAWDGSAISPGH